MLFITITDFFFGDCTPTCDYIPQPGSVGFDLTTEFNAEDYVSRVELIANGNGKEINLGQADAKNIPYKDLFGNPLERIQILSENEIPLAKLVG